MVMGSIPMSYITVPLAPVPTVVLPTRTVGAGTLAVAQLMVTLQVESFSSMAQLVMLRKPTGVSAGGGVLLLPPPPQIVDEKFRQVFGGFHRILRCCGAADSLIARIPPGQ
jgi:hypothetical protein